jgi:hypothetical protein
MIRKPALVGAYVVLAAAAVLVILLPRPERQRADPLHRLPGSIRIAAGPDTESRPWILDPDFEPTEEERRKAAEALTRWLSEMNVRLSGEAGTAPGESADDEE